jgi:hypothetical protein
MEKGAYWIKQGNKRVIALWNGEVWHAHIPLEANVEVESGPIAYSCPTGCTCTLNADGSTTVNCSGGGGQ